ncbi:hypothetical protein DM02DRAFT_664184 [Periconia macrospinosa]|uniref:Rhodopsin domain-containing protein n=1 Tax=Periconia macrospinosa TaxID=97972 RepID=A0A2V1CZP5_9PLEO|nr:hypothetical protein DM02DRAFT_664184 [Periconia macrospinosa]
MLLYPPSIVMPIYGIFTAIGIMLTFLRFFVRASISRTRHTRNPFGLDDLFILVGLVIVCTCAAIQFYKSIHGNGGEATSSTTKAHEAIVEYKIDFAMLVIEKPAFGAIKLSLLLFYRGIFGHWSSFQKINNWLMALIMAWTLSFMLADLFLCGAHPEYQWILDQKPNRARCGDKGLLLILFGLTSVITDALVVGLLLLYLRRLRLRFSKRFAAYGVFLLGGTSTLAGILRTIFLCVAYPHGRLTWGYISPPEAKVPPTLKVINPTFWVMMEMLLGLWAANLPTLAPLVRTINNRFRSSTFYRTFSRSDRIDTIKPATALRTTAHLRPLKTWNESYNDSKAMSEEHPLV